MTTTVPPAKSRRQPTPTWYFEPLGWPRSNVHGAPPIQGSEVLEAPSVYMNALVPWLYSSMKEAFR